MDSAPTNFGQLPEASHHALTELLLREDPSIIGIILTGSAARGMATPHSDVDVIVVCDDSEESKSTRQVSLSPAIDEIRLTLAELETIKPVGSEGAWDRWSFAWAQILRDTIDGRLSAAVQRQATLDDNEIRDLLIGRARLDEFINFAYRALKSHRDGRRETARLDSAESVASMLDVVFALEGRIRPYNKYLAWELREHPLVGGDWQVGVFLDRVNGLLDGREAVVRECFLAVEKGCRALEERTGREMLAGVIDAWGEELLLLRGY